MSDAAKCSLCSVEIDDPGDDWDPETDICLACGYSELEEQRDSARRELEELKKEMDADWDEFSQVNRQTAAHIEKQNAELAELRKVAKLLDVRELNALIADRDELLRLVEAFGDASFPYIYAADETAVSACRAYNRKRKANQ